MKDFKKINNTIGLLFGVCASIVYLMTSEPTVSLWDCGEFTTTSYKLMVGHPPGAPFFQLFGHIFMLFTGNDRTHVARMFNTMTALASGCSVMFLYWSIIALVKKFYLKDKEYETGRMFAVFGAGIIGAGSYMFTDSFWFSATEGIVWASASFFTALVFWAMLKWDAAADEPNHWRWIILISYLVGCSIGVHLLNLLTIPAMVFIYYFRKFTPTRKGVIYTFFISLALTGFVMKGIIPWSLKLAGWSELFFVNVIGLPFNSGTIIYFIILCLALLYGV